MPGSEYESVALEALLAATRATDVRLAQNGYGRLGAFTNRAAVVVPVLLKGLEHPKMKDSCIYALKILGATRDASVQGAIDRVAAMFSAEQQEELQRTISKEDAVLKLMELF